MATLDSTSRASAQPQQASVNFKWLNALYLCLPLCLIIVFADQLFLSQQIQQLLPHSPQTLLAFAIFFGLPHIIASNAILVSNRDYSIYYKKHIAIVSIAIAGFLILANTVFSYTLTYFIYAALTIIHVLKQQFGLTRAVAGLNGINYQLWLWSGILAGIAIYTAVFMFKLLSNSQLEMLKLTSICLTLFYVVQGFRLHKSARPGIGRLYLWSNTLLIPVSLSFYLLGYSFFTILCPRLVHDCTAFLIYIAHDHNRRISTQKNKLYSYADKLKIPTFVIVLGIAIGIAYLLRWQGEWLFGTLSLGAISSAMALQIALLLKTYLELMHYYMESITWKQGSPYRNYVKFSMR